MASSDPVIALPWYHRRDYAALLELLSDPEMMPMTYDLWLDRAEGVERAFKTAGFGVARVLIQPAPFAAWCRGQNVLPDQAARLNYANTVSRLDATKS